MNADACQLCGEIWNRQNLTTIKIKNKNLNLCSECLQDFRNNTNSVLEDIKAEIKRKANSGQWSDATVYGMQKAIAIIDKHISGK